MPWRRAGGLCLGAAAIISGLVDPRLFALLTVGVVIGFLAGGCSIRLAGAPLPPPLPLDLSARALAAIGPLALLWAGARRLRSGWAGHTGAAQWWGWGFVAAATVLVTAARLSPAFRSTIGRIAHSVGHTVGAALRIAGFGLMGVLTVVPSWALSSIKGVINRPRTTGWSSTARATSSLFSPGPASPGLAAQIRHGRRRRWVLVAAVPLLLLAGVIALRRWTTPGDDVLDAPAMASSPWWPELSRAQTQLTGYTTNQGWAVSTLPYSFHSSLLNIDGHRRRSWAPPEQPGARCGRRFTVWAAGGSTMFGYGQRDDHTIASELARLLHQQGFDVRVVNFGAPGDTLWMQTLKVDEALLTSPSRPDLVVFYDGVNDYGSQSALAQLGRAGTPPLAAFEDGGLFETIRTTFNAINRWVLPRVASSAAVFPPGSTDAIGATAQQYKLSVAMADRLLGSYGVAGLWFLQPVRATRHTAVPGEKPSADKVDETPTRTAFAAMAAATHGHVIDLRSAMDTQRKPVYYDGLHTNELGAQVVAAAMSSHVLERLATCPAPVKADGP